MLRLACVFFVWIASTAWALDDADADYDFELHEAHVQRDVLRAEKPCASAAGSRLARRTCIVLRED